MRESELLELYPDPGRTRPLAGTYLDERWLDWGSPEQPFAYANFVSSIDGRIAVAEGDSAEGQLPEALANPHDWRLFQELQAPADCQVTHSAYLRALAAGQLGNILQVGTSQEAADIGRWRRERGLVAQPAIAIVSRSLEFPMPEPVHRHGQAVHILTGRQAPPERVRYWQSRGYPVHFAGSGQAVEGGAMLRTLGGLGFVRPHLLAGPQMLTAVVRDRALSRLFVTLTHQILGGETIHTLATGPLLGEAGRLQLHSLYYDPAEPAGAGQWFASFRLAASAE